jgi:penicillin-binding protein 2
MLTDEKANHPMLNRAIAAAYPPASTYKAFVGLAALSKSIDTTQTVVNCKGAWDTMGKWDVKMCWNFYGHGNMDMRSAVAQSCNVFFYDIGYKFETKSANAKEKSDEDSIEVLQKYLKDWGFGSVLGIDLPGETPGRVPTEEWKLEYNKVDPGFGPWVPGDGVHLAIGQGDVLATPLQLASAFSAIAYEGKVIRPHILKNVLDSSGNAAFTSKPEVIYTPEVSKRDLGAMRAYLRGVVTGGTAADGFYGFNTPVAGKTGTAEIGANAEFEHAWFVGFAPYGKPKYCVAVVVENGGAGGVTATPATRAIFGALFDESTHFSLGNDKSR